MGTPRILNQARTLPAIWPMHAAAMYRLFYRLKYRNTSFSLDTILVVPMVSVVERFQLYIMITELPVFAEVSGASTVGAVVGVLLAAALLIAAVIVTSIVVYTMYIKKSKLQIIMS